MCVCIYHRYTYRTISECKGLHYLFFSEHDVHAIIRKPASPLSIARIGIDEPACVGSRRMAHTVNARQAQML